MSRAVLVTGGSRGIGAAVCRAFIERGDRVAVHYASNRQAAEAIGGTAVVGADLADPDATRAMVDQAAEVLGGIDVLVNNAGIFEAHPILDTPFEAWVATWRRTMAVNLDGAAHATWAAVRHMGRGGRVVNVASRGAFRGEPEHPAYGASKAGMVSLSQSLARALGPAGISVTAVAPGFTETDMAAPYLEGDERSRREAESPLGRIAAPEDVAAAVMFLASPEAEFATGTVIDVNGASFLRM